MKSLQSSMFEKNSEVGVEKYFDMLNILPPAAMALNGFLVGEAWDHKSLDGSARYEFYFRHGQKYYYGGLATVADFLLFLIPDEPIQGRQYRLTGGPDDAAISNGHTWEESSI